MVGEMRHQTESVESGQARATRAGWCSVSHLPENNRSVDEGEEPSVTEEPTSGAVVGDTGVRGLDERASEPAWQHEEYHGRRVSWVAVTLIIAGFIIGGGGPPHRSHMVLFWVGAAIVVVGVIFAASIRIMDDWY